MASGASPAETFLGVLLQTERASDAELNAYQTELLTRLVRHAFTNVPFFADRGAPPERMDPRSAAWRYPALHVAQRPYAAREGPEAAGRFHRSTDRFPRPRPAAAPARRPGGIFPHSSRLAGLARASACFWPGISTNPAISSGSESHGPSQDHSYDRWGFPWRPEDKLGRRQAMDIAAPPDRQLELINRYAPAYVHTLPSNVLRLVIEARRSGPRPAHSQLHDRRRVPLIRSQGGRTGDLRREDHRCLLLRRRRGHRHPMPGQWSLSYPERDHSCRDPAQRRRAGSSRRDR